MVVNISISGTNRMPWHLSVRTLKYQSVFPFSPFSYPFFPFPSWCATFLASSLFSLDSDLHHLWSRITLPWSHQ